MTQPTTTGGDVRLETAPQGGLRARVAELLSGLPLQTLPGGTPEPTPAETAEPSPNGHATHHPHAQTGSTPQLHP